MSSRSIGRIRRKLGSFRAAGIVLTVIGGTACDPGPDYVVDVGLLAYENGMPSIEVPSSVAVGAGASVRAITIGGGCVSVDSTTVELDAAGADVTPYDRRRIPDDEHGPCSGLATPLAHDAMLLFQEAGSKTIRFHVRRYTVGGADELIEVPVQLMVE